MALRHHRSATTCRTAVQQFRNQRRGVANVAQSSPVISSKCGVMLKRQPAVIIRMRSFSTTHREFVSPSMSSYFGFRRRSITTVNPSLRHSYAFNDARHMEIMRAWQISRFQEEMPEMHLAHDVPVPKIQQPDDVLIEVNAASINPLGTMMAKGYGRTVTSTMRQAVSLMFSNGRDYNLRSRMQPTFPLTLGRDFSGTILDVGPGVRKFKVGDTVYGTVGAHRPGSHAEFVVTSANCIGHKPSEISDVEASSLPWVACTTYSALVYSGGVMPSNASQRTVLIIGAGGGLGQFAVQLLKTWNATVIAIVKGHEQQSIVRSNCRDVDEVIDGKDASFLERVELCGPYDVLLDAAGDADMAQQCANFLRKNHLSSRFVTLSSPLLRNTDRYRLIPGAALSAVDFAKQYLGAVNQGYQYHWAFYMPNGRFLNGDLRRYLNEKRIKPVIQREFGFAEMPQAFKTMKDSSRGKIVVNMKRDTVADGHHEIHSPKPHSSSPSTKMEQNLLLVHADRKR